MSKLDPIPAWLRPLQTDPSGRHLRDDTYARYAEGDYDLDQRQPRQHNSRYMGWIAQMPCISCAIRLGRTVRPVQVAHIRCSYEQEEGDVFWRPVGMQEKPHDTRTAPLCVKCHLDGPHAQHKNRGGDEKEWWAKLGVYPPDLVRDLVAAFIAKRPGGPVLAHHVAKAATIRHGRSL